MSNLEAVLVQLKQERNQLNQAITALERIGNRSGRRTASRRTLSASARARIAAAQRARWAKVRGRKVVSIA